VAPQASVAQISNLKSHAEGVSRQLRAWADPLQNSTIPGQRYLTEKTQKASQARAERAERRVGQARHLVIAFTRPNGA
jgi:hypothetical protein